MASPSVGLDSGPPLPPGVSQKGGLSSLAGSQQPQQAAGNDLQSSVINDFMLIEKALDSISSKVPQFAPYADQFRNQVREVGSKLIQGLSQPQQAAPPNPLAAMSAGGPPPQV